MYTVLTYMMSHRHGDPEGQTRTVSGATNAQKNVPLQSYQVRQAVKKYKRLWHVYLVRNRK